MRCPFCAEEIKDAAVKCKHCGEMLAESGGRGQPRMLYRSRSDSLVAGVCGGLAEYAEMDSTVMRLLVALAILASGIVAGVIAYIVMAVVVPIKE